MPEAFAVNVVVQEGETERAAAMYQRCFELTRAKAEGDESVVLEYDLELRLVVSSVAAEPPKYRRGRSFILRWHAEDLPGLLAAIRAEGFDVERERRDRAGNVVLAYAVGPFGHRFLLKQSAPRDHEPSEIRRLQERPRVWGGPTPPYVFEVEVEPGVVDDAVATYLEGFDLDMYQHERDGGVLLKHPSGCFVRVGGVEPIEPSYEKGRDPRVAWRVVDIHGSAERLEEIGFSELWRYEDESGDLLKVYFRGPFGHVWGIWSADI